MKALMKQMDFGAYGQMASHFFSWWGKALYEPLPETVKEHFARTGPRELKLGAKVSQGDMVQLVLPSESCLEKRVQLPRAAEKSLGSAMHMQLERLSPLDVSEIIAGWQVVERGPETIDVSLRMAKLQQVTQEIRHGEASGAVVTGVYSEDGLKFNDCDYLLKVRAKKHLKALSVFGGVAVLVLSAVLIFFARLDEANDRAEARVSVLRETSRELVASRQRVAAYQGNYDFLSLQLKAGDPLTLLDRLTGVLPETAWLQSVKIDGEDLIIVGETANAAELAVMVGEHASVKTVSLRSVNPSGVQEHFEMLLTLQAGEESEGE